MQAELIYQILNGEIEQNEVLLPDGVEVADEFSEDRECGRLYERVYKAKLRLGKRLGMDEDSDVEEIINCMTSSPTTRLLISFSSLFRISASTSSTRTSMLSMLTGRL